jgi:hypothetical protein
VVDDAVPGKIIYLLAGSGICWCAFDQDLTGKPITQRQMQVSVLAVVGTHIPDNVTCLDTLTRLHCYFFKVGIVIGAFVRAQQVEAVQAEFVLHLLLGLAPAVSVQWQDVSTMTSPAIAAAAFSMDDW